MMTTIRAKTKWKRAFGRLHRRCTLGRRRCLSKQALLKILQTIITRQKPTSTIVSRQMWRDSKPRFTGWWPFERALVTLLSTTSLISSLFIRRSNTWFWEWVASSRSLRLTLNSKTLPSSARGGFRSRRALVNSWFRSGKARKTSTFSGTKWLSWLSWVRRVAKFTLSLAF